MATRSTIAVQQADGTVSQIYAHWDGYLDGNGQLLQTYYNSQELAEALVSLGSISSLAERRDPLGTTHTYDTPEKDVTVYYGRDRGETEVEPTVYTNFSDYKKNGDSQEYDYVFMGGEWFVSCYETNDKFVALAQVLANENA